MSKLTKAQVLEARKTATTQITATVGALNTTNDRTLLLINTLTINLVDAMISGAIKPMVIKLHQEIETKLISEWLENNVAPMTGLSWQGSGSKSLGAILKGQMREAARPALAIGCGAIVLGTNMEGEVMHSKSGAITVNTAGMDEKTQAKFNGGGQKEIGMNQTQLQALAKIYIPSPVASDRKGGLEVAIKALNDRLIAQGSQRLDFKQMYEAEILIETIESMVEDFKGNATEEEKTQLDTYRETMDATDAPDAAYEAKTEAA